MVVLRDECLDGILALADESSANSRACRRSSRADGLSSATGDNTTIGNVQRILDGICLLIDLWSDAMVRHVKETDSVIQNKSAEV
ncbi:hypothetical protein [Bradyrhizobium canariense]|uniref:hypothetical protein n=1 Tax=Bradyrhizobium canariense TaxID=255045 RepID=UPI001B8A534B|nr:hypothetical protein [Bradyrhizobium canariense]MBR0953800.1 hypothetical protein [Bradyrhizobium canariense]